MQHKIYNLDSKQTFLGIDLSDQMILQARAEVPLTIGEVIQLAQAGEAVEVHRAAGGRVAA